MNPQEIDFDRYNSVQREIGKFNDIQSILKEAYELIKGVKEEKEKNKKNPENYKKLEELEKKFIKEYIDLEKSIKESISSDKNISIEERKRIMFELSDIVALAEKNNIKEHTNLWSKLGDIKRSIGGNDNIDTKKAKNEAVELNEKKELITKYFKKEKFSETELKKLLTISNEERQSKGENKTGNLAGYAARWLSLDSTSADLISTQEEVLRTNQFQDDIIKRIGLEKGYNESGEIIGYNKEKGNFLLSVSDFERTIKFTGVQNLSNKALKNYLNYLDGTGKLNNLYLNDKLGKDRAKELIEFSIRNKNPDFLDKANFLNNLGKIFEEIVNYVKDKINGLFNKLTSSKDLKEFQNNLQEIKNYNSEEKSELIKKFDEEIQKKESALMKKFIEPIKAKLIKEGKSENEASIESEKIAKEVLNNIKNNLEPTRLGEAFRIINEFNKDYNVTLDGKITTQKAVDLSKTENQRDRAQSEINREIAVKSREEAKRRGDTDIVKRENEKISEHDKKIKAQDIKQQGFDISDKILVQTTTKQARDIGTGKLDYKEHLEKILNTDENLRNEIKKLDAEKKKLEEEIIRTDDIINKTENASNQVIDAGNAQYNPENGNVKIGEKTLNLSTEEQKLIENNPDSLKNIVDFYSTLNKVGLAKLWPLKEQIFNVIGSIKGVGFKIDQNYLSENETKIFLNEILKSIGEDIINPILGINDFIATIERKNNTQFSGAEEQVNITGDTKIEQKFISSFAPRGNLIGFNSNAFEQKIKS